MYLNNVYHENNDETSNNLESDDEIPSGQKKSCSPLQNDLEDLNDTVILSSSDESNSSFVTVKTFTDIYPRSLCFHCSFSEIINQSSISIGMKEKHVSTSQKTYDNIQSSNEIDNNILPKMTRDLIFLKKFVSNSAISMVLSESSIKNNMPFKPISNTQ